jgi:predicted RecB family endonuclease
MGRIKSLKDAVQQAIDSGATTVEEVYMKVSRLPFEQLARIAAIEGVVKKARTRHDRSVAQMYDAIRKINKRVGQLADQALRRLGLETAPRRARKAKKR